MSESHLTAIVILIITAVRWLLLKWWGRAVVRLAFDWEQGRPPNSSATNRLPLCVFLIGRSGKRSARSKGARRSSSAQALVNRPGIIHQQLGIIRNLVKLSLPKTNLPGRRLVMLGALLVALTL